MCLVQKELGEKHAHWMTTLQGYDLEINPTKIVKGRLYKLVVDSVSSPRPNLFSENDESLFSNEILCSSNDFNSWYVDINFFVA